MVGCSVLGCKSRSERNIKELTFHSFPKDPYQKKIWVAATGRLNWKATKFMKMCSLHFDSKCIIKKNKTKRLVRNAVPIINVHNEIPLLHSVTKIVPNEEWESDNCKSPTDWLNSNPGSPSNSSDTISVHHTRTSSDFNDSNSWGINEDPLKIDDKCRPKPAPCKTCTTLKKKVCQLENQVIRLQKVSKRRLLKVKSLRIQATRFKNRSNLLIKRCIESVKNGDIEEDKLLLIVYKPRQ